MNDAILPQTYLKPYRIAIVGGGISGLFIAHEILKKQQNLNQFEIHILEKSSQWGGCIQTHSHEGRTYEWGPEFLLGTPEIIDLLKELHISYELIPHAPRFLFTKDQMLPFSPFKILGFKGSLRFFLEPIYSLFSPQNGTAYEIFRRHFGKQVSEKLLTPMTYGIWGGGSHVLDFKNAFPKIDRVQQKYKSWLLGFLIEFLKSIFNSQRSKQRLIYIASGMHTLIDTLVKSYPEHVKCVLEKDIQNPTDLKKDYDVLFWTAPPWQNAHSFEGKSWNQLSQLKTHSFHVSYLQGIGESHVKKGLGGLTLKEVPHLLGMFFLHLLKKRQYNLKIESEEMCLRFFWGGEKFQSSFTPTQKDAQEYAQKYGFNFKDVTFSKSYFWENCIPLPSYPYLIEEIIENLESENQGIFFAGNYTHGQGVHHTLNSGQSAVGRWWSFYQNQP